MREIWWLAQATALEPGGALGRHGLVSVAAAMADRPGARRLSSDRQSAAVMLPGPPPLLVKWRRPHGVRRALKAFGRASRERREAVAALAARRRGIATPAPLAVGERRSRGFLVGAALVRPFFPRMRPADERLGDPDGAEVAVALTRALRRWHDLGWRHGDAYPKNVLVEPRTLEAWPIGFPSASFPPPGPRMDRARLEDLAQWLVGLAGVGAPREGERAASREEEEAAFAYLACYAEAPGLAPVATFLPDLRRLHARLLARKARRRATRPQREPHGPPAPPPLPPDLAPPRRVVRPMGALGEAGATSPSREA